MKKTEKIKIPLLLFGMCLAVCWIFVLQYGILGSDLDWVNQHSVRRIISDSDFTIQDSFFLILRGI